MTFELPAASLFHMHVCLKETIDPATFVFHLGIWTHFFWRTCHEIIAVFFYIREVVICPSSAMTAQLLDLRFVSIFACVSLWSSGGGFRVATVFLDKFQVFKKNITRYCLSLVLTSSKCKTSVNHSQVLALG